jgi:hypothetical protein
LIWSLKNAAAIVLSLCAATATASACQRNGNALLDDNFKNPDPGWGQPDKIAAFTPTGLALTPPVSGSAWRLNTSVAMASADFCIEVMSPAKLPNPPDEDAIGAVGIWFWGKDLQNFYTATITLDGQAAVMRLVGGKWVTVVAPAAAPSVKTGPAAVNEIEVVTEGNTAKFFVNGTHITDISGAALPDGGGAPGLYGESGPKGTTWLFPRARLF